MYESYDDKWRLSKPQLAVLGFIESYIKEHGYAPSIRDIQADLGTSSTSVVTYYLDKLQDKGYIERDRFVARSIRIVGG